MKIAYIAHPVSGDVKNNLLKIKNIARQINLNEPNVAAFAPYFLTCHALNDNVPAERHKGISTNIAILEKGMIDEIRLYGDRISEGMELEIKIGIGLKIPIRAMTDETNKELTKILF